MLNYQKWFPEARFGMFIHWGIYSICGQGEWVLYTNAVPPEEYRKLADEFIPPSRFSPEEWVLQAKKAGMKYMVFTAKHHDGFCLFDSRYTDFSSAKTGSKRDFVAEYVEACRKHQMKIGLYFSAKDWQFPAYFDGPEKNPAGWKKFISYYTAQVKELMTNYGKIDILWFDGGDMAHFGESPEYSAQLWNAVELEAWIRRKQPGILINGRSSMRADFKTMEKGGYNTMDPSSHLIELCETMGEGWGYRSDDSIMTSREAFKLLAQSASNATNLLLNVSPTRDGALPAAQGELLHRIGGFLEKNGEAFYGTERILPAWWEMINYSRIATRKNIAYLYLLHQPQEGTLTFWKLGNRVLRATVLATGAPLQVSEDRGRTRLAGIPPRAPEEFGMVLKLELDGPARTGVPENLFGSNRTKTKTGEKI